MSRFKTYLTVLAFIAIFSAKLIGQSGSIEGRIYSSEGKQAIDLTLVNLLNEKTSELDISKEDGSFEFDSLNFGEYQVTFSNVGYEDDTITVSINSQKPNLFLEVELKQANIALDEVVLVAKPFKESFATPLSSKSMGQIEILTSPGSGSDIAKVMQVLPGVATTSSFRNDLIIRGGAPSENSFYIDGIRVPSINHLTTQGSSGGAVSMINADFIREAELISGSFPALRGNALSSVFHFNLLDGSNEEPSYRLSAGATNLSLDAYGAVNDKLSYIASVRRSYRQYILRLLNLAVYPVYNDMLVKVKYKPSYNHEVTLLGIGALDKLRLNDDVASSEVQRYLINNLPLSDQWNYTIGAKNVFYSDKEAWTFVASRSHLYNKASRDVTFEGEVQAGLRYESTEINNIIASDYSFTDSWGSIQTGLELINRNATFDVFNRSFDDTGLREVEYESGIDYLMYAGHFQLGLNLIPERWNFSFGFRLDASNYASQLENPLEQFSPRASTKFQLTENLSLNASVGLYYQLPQDVTLGYSENNRLVNQDIVNYIQSLQYVGGLSFITPFSSRFTLEFFRKEYDNYPVNLRFGISQANEGGDFGIAGNSPISSSGEGLSQGLELMYEQKFYKSWFGTFSYTFSNSKFGNGEGDLVASSWDANHIVNTVIGRKLKNNWQVGLNLRYQSALPYTPYDLINSSNVAGWDVNRAGIRNFALLNTERGKSNLFLDFRIDKKWDYKWGDLTFYFDLENVFADADSQQILVQDKTDAEGKEVEDPVILNPQAPSFLQRYKLKELQNAEGVAIPTFGFIAEF